MSESRITYYYHPSADGYHKVSVILHWHGNKKKPFRYHLAWFDEPGTVFENHWNVHWDGFDHKCNSLEDCAKQLADCEGVRDYELVITDEECVDERVKYIK